MLLDVSEDRFKVEVIMTDEMKKTNKDYFGYAFLVSSNFLMALNIAALGHFTWTAGNRLFWHCEHIGPSGKSDQILMQSQEGSFPVEKIVLSQKVWFVTLSLLWVHCCVIKSRISERNI